MSSAAGRERLRLRTVFISDVHLGSKGCNAEYLLDFLHSVETEQLYLVGDIVDLWSLKKNFYWPDTHNEILGVVLDKARRGTRVIYVPGNHDEILRVYNGLIFSNVEIRREAVHITAAGKRLLVLHGDEFDGEARCAAWLTHLGERIYGWVSNLDRQLRWLRRKLDRPHWSLAAYLKDNVKKSMQYIADFERAAARAAAARAMDGVICGHIHRAKVANLDGMLYCNDGDWVESCTALVEDHRGKLSLLKWTERSEALGHELSPAVAVELAA